MDKIKDKYEVILGFVTLVISFSAFKDELEKIKVDLGYIQFSISEYFLLMVFGFTISLYLYIVERIARDTKIGNWKIFDYLIKIAYFIFTAILITPILVILNILIYKISVFVSDNYDVIINISPKILISISSFIGGLITFILTNIILKETKRRLRDNIEEQEIKDLDNASKLYSDGYYSHSVLESYKVLESHLYKKIIEKNIRVSPHRINDILGIAIRENIINTDDMIIINDIKNMRNSAAHSNIQHNANQALFALEYVRQLLQR